MESLYNLKIKNGRDQIMNFTDWQKETVDTLNEHKNIKKVWLVNNQRKTGATYFSKLLMYFRPPCTNTFVISQNLYWSKYLAWGDDVYNIEFWVEDKRFNKYSEWHKASNFLTPITLFGLEKEIKKHKICKETTIFECLYDMSYDNEFDVEKYITLCSYNFNFFIINVSSKDLEKARPFIEADKDKEDVLIVNIENTLKLGKLYESEDKLEHLNVNKC